MQSESVILNDVNKNSKAGPRSQVSGKTESHHLHFTVFLRPDT